MSTWEDNVARFHKLGGRPAPEKIDFEGWNGWLRLALMQEELEEIDVAFDLWRKAKTPEAKEQHESEIIDGLVDLLYVTIGSAVEAGVDLDPFWDEVQRANISKVDGSLGALQMNDAGKITKPQGWRAPDMLGLLKRIKEKQRGG